MKKLLLILVLLFTINSFSQAVYKIENDTLKGWTGTSEFKKPILVDGVVVEGWTAEDQIIKDSIINQQLLDVDISAVKENKFRSDGEIEYNRIKHKLRRALDTGFLTPTEFDQIYKPIRQKIIWLNTGDWDIAQENINAIPSQTGNKLIILDKIKLIINNYILENY